MQSVRAQPGDRRPVCHTTLYLNMELESIEVHAAANYGPMTAMLERVYGIRIVEIDQSIEAMALDAESARSLCSKPGAPALKAIRRYYDRSKKLIEMAIAIHPGERFVYTTRLLRT